MTGKATTYYNENDPYAAQWLRNLIAEGLIADGKVDDRSIVDVKPGDLDGFLQCHFFAGLGGWSGALRLAGVPDEMPIWTGSCPCQPFSVAGSQKGFADARHLWPVWKNLIRKRRPAIVLGEQVASAAAWLGLVRGDLEAMDYAVGAIPVEAASAGADHLRDRIWFVASDMGLANSTGWRAGQQATEAVGHRSAVIAASGVLADTDIAGSQGRQLLSECADQRAAEADCLGDAAIVAERKSNNQGDPLTNGGQTRPVSGGAGDHLDWVIGADGKARRVKPGIRLLAHGVPQRVAKLRALGNAIDLRPAAIFIEAVMECAP